MENKKTIEHNSEILFLYDAKLCNPNGDPDEENRPRMDYETGRNLVSDVRLKRYLRDYWLSLGKDIWVRKVNGETVSAKERIEQLWEEYLKENSSKSKEVTSSVQDKKFHEWLLKKLVDVRMFGAVMPIEGKDKKKGGHITFTGPVQFSWGYSLNKVDLLPSYTLTTHFSSGGKGNGEAEYGSMGKDWRVKYSFIAFYGIISALRAKETNLTEEDLKLLDESMVRCLPLIATTRSKIGQKPRLYLRIEYKDCSFFLGDLRTYLSLKEEIGINDIEEVDISFKNLLEFLKNNKGSIERVYCWVDEGFSKGRSFVEELEKEFQGRLEKAGRGEAESNKVS
jgi:CRISPR-associated protein Csh2